MTALSQMSAVIFHGRQSWPRDFEQGDKWIFCLTAARIAA
jgi:hypothetical protein